MPLPILFALAALAQAAPSEAELRNAPDWIRLPTAAEIAAAYPAAARRQRISGQAELDCALDRDGRLAGCKVAEETPAGYGFGPAALSLAVRFQMTPLYPDGTPVAGGRITVPIYFSAKRR